MSHTEGDTESTVGTSASSDWEIRNETGEDLTLLACEPTSLLDASLKTGSSATWTASSTTFTYQGAGGYISGTVQRGDAGPAMWVECDQGYVVERSPSRLTIKTARRDRVCAPGASAIRLDNSGAGGGPPSPPGPNQSDDDAVRQWIRWGLAKGQAQDPQADLATQRSNAHAALMLERDSRCGDLALACAEHYMFARWVVALKGATGWAIIAGSTYVYQGVKVVLWAFGSLDRATTGKCPVTNPSFAEWAWAAGGANDGLRDHR